MSLQQPIYLLALLLIPLGVLAAVAVGMIVFGQVAQRTQYSMLEGRPGAAASIVEFAAIVVVSPFEYVTVRLDVDWL